MLYKTSIHSLSLKPTKTKPLPIKSGRFTSIPSVARSFNCSSSDIAGSLSLSSIDLYRSPDVLKNFFQRKSACFIPSNQLRKTRIILFDIPKFIFNLVVIKPFFRFQAGCAFGVANKFKHRYSPF